MEGYSAYVIPSEDVVLGSTYGRYLSPVRRFFCLLVTFDLLFTVLLWVLTIILAKGDTSIIEAFRLEVIQYSFITRLFDVVMSAAVRFVILLLFYGLLECQHWLPVALTTTSTCAFLLVKVFLFKWDSLSIPTYPVMLILTSFVLAWSEAWFFDFRVVPQEIQAAMFHARQSAGAVGGESQRVITWLGRSVSQIAQNPPFQRSYPESTADFFSLPESPVHSEGENEDSETESMEKRAKRLYRNRTPSLASPQSPEKISVIKDFKLALISILMKRYKYTVCSIIGECKLWLQHAPLMAQQLIDRVKVPGWKVEKVSDAGDTVYIKKSPRKIFMISGIIPSPASKIAFELFQNFELMPHWNPGVIHCEILQRLNSSTDVSYQVSKEGAGGAVAPRDFVTLRHLTVLDSEIHVLASESVKHPAKPKQQKITRGTNGTGGWIFTPIEGQPSMTEYQWVLEVELSIPGWIPKTLVDNGIIQGLFETVKSLRTKLSYTVDRLDIQIDTGAEASAASLE